MAGDKGLTTHVSHTAICYMHRCHPEDSLDFRCLWDARRLVWISIITCVLAPICLIRIRQLNWFKCLTDSDGLFVFSDATSCLIIHQWPFDLGSRLREYFLLVAAWRYITSYIPPWWRRCKAEGRELRMRCKEYVYRCREDLWCYTFLPLYLS